MAHLEAPSSSGLDENVPQLYHLVEMMQWNRILLSITPRIKANIIHRACSVTADVSLESLAALWMPSGLKYPFEPIPFEE